MDSSSKQSFKDMPDGAFNAALRQAMSEKTGDLKLTKDEIKNFEDAMKKPEFTNLLKEYMDDISDPKYREEQEKYLRQLEEKNEIPEGKNLLKPKAGFCAKTKRVDAKDTGGPSKVFINVCHAKEVEKATSEEVTRDGKRGVSWSIPFSLGPMRQEKDKKGNPAMTFDFAVNTDTLAKARADQRFRKMVVELAMEHIEKRSKQVMKDHALKLDRTYHVLKGVACMGKTPAIQTIATNKAKSKTPSLPLQKKEKKKRIKRKWHQFQRKILGSPSIPSLSVEAKTLPSFLKVLMEPHLSPLVSSLGFT